MEIQETIKVFLRQRPLISNEIQGSGFGGIGKILHSEDGSRTDYLTTIVWISNIQSFCRIYSSTMLYFILL